MSTTKALLDAIKQQLAEQTELELAVLIGSRATGKETESSDWDFAIRWIQSLKPMQRLGKTEHLRRQLAKQLSVPENQIDLIDLVSAGLTIRAAVAEEGVALKGENTLAWNYFLQRTWRDLEDFYWNEIYAN